MVVDDSITMRKVTSRVLENHSLEVMTAQDGLDAIQSLHDRIPDLMLLDIEMPRMDGYELAEHVRADARLRHIPIVMITSRAGQKHRKKARDAGANAYLTKPYQEAELVAGGRNAEAGFAAEENHRDASRTDKNTRHTGQRTAARNKPLNGRRVPRTDRHSGNRGAVTVAQVHCTLAPMQSESLLLPTNVIAEVVEYTQPAPIHSAPQWFLARLNGKTGSYRYSAMQRSSVAASRTPLPPKPAS
jgi:CheY-like chemotaxis protein